MDWSTVDFPNLANGLLVLIVGLLTFLGIRGGRQKAARPMEAELAGALVDSGSVNRLTAAIEAQTMERMAGRQEAKDGAHMLARRLEALTKQLEELGEEVRNLREEMIRKR